MTREVPNPATSEGWQKIQNGIKERKWPEDNKFKSVAGGSPDESSISNPHKQTATAQESALPSEPLPSHAHYWKIPEPDGQIAVGVCKHCGSEKQFKNWLNESDFITNTEHRLAAGEL